MMKKLMLLTMMFGLMVVFSGSVSAQTLSLSFAIGDGAVTPEAGQQFVIASHTRINSEPNAPAGTKYFTVKFMKDGKQLAGGQLQATPAQAKGLASKGSLNWTITKVDNPLPIRKYDGINLSFGNNHYVEIEVIQGNAKKNLGKMRLYLK